jgi:hypothetical protein
VSGFGNPTVREWWLAYARSVVDPTDPHRRDCFERRGSLRGDYPTDVRWPGYLGPGYRVSGMLIIANIHRNFDSGGAGTDAAFAARAVEVVRDWIQGRATDNQYLERTAEIYKLGLESWVVGTNMGRAMRFLGVPASNIAYTNGAKCQAPDTGKKLQAICQVRWPLRSMVAALRPRIVIISSTALEVAGPAPWPAASTVIGINQRRGGMIAERSPWQPPDTKPLFEDWSRHLGALWAG